MEDVLAVYTRPHDPDRPLVCLDETSKQLVGETRAPMPVAPGRPARHDYEYKRNGTANLFMLFAPLEGWRHVKPTARRTAVDYAHVLKEVSDVHFPRACPDHRAGSGHRRTRHSSNRSRPGNKHDDARIKLKNLTH